VIVGLNSASEGFFETKPPYSNEQLLRFVRRVTSLGFEAVQIGPLRDFDRIEAGQLRTVLDAYKTERKVHVGGIYDAGKFASTQEEYVKAQKEVRYGLMLCRRLSSSVLSLHPLFFAAENVATEELQYAAKRRFLELVEEEVDFASRNHIKMALESFCYPPFIFRGLDDFWQFVSRFPFEEMGVLLDMGHLYHAGIELSSAVHAFAGRLVDVHVHDATRDKDYRKATHLPIGKGEIDFSDLLNLLHEAGYDGWLTLEIRAGEKEVLQSRDFLESVLARSF
jgi:sugar phosphate isomerase/epimerase